MADDAITMRHETISRIIFLTKDYFIKLFQGIYEKAVSEKRSNRYILKDFQLQIKQFCLSDISYIDDQMKNTYQEVGNLVKVLEDISHVTFPTDFWKTCCLNMAREIWMKPYLFYENVPEQDYISNRIAAEKIVTNCLKTFLRQTAVMNIDHLMKEQVIEIPSIPEKTETIEEKQPDETNNNVVTLTNENPSTCDMTCYSTEDKQVVCDLTCTNEKTVVMTNDHDKNSTDNDGSESQIESDSESESESDDDDKSEYDEESDKASVSSVKSNISNPPTSCITPTMSTASAPNPIAVTMDKTPLNTPAPLNTPKIAEKPEEKHIILDANLMEKKIQTAKVSEDSSDSDTTPIAKPDSMTRYKEYYNPAVTKKRVGSFRFKRNRLYRS